MSVEANTPTASDYGENAESWTALETVWASIEAVSAKELVRSGLAVGSITHLIRMRYRDDLAGSAMLGPEHRLMHDGRAFEIVGVREVDRREYLEISAVETARP